MKNPKYGSGTRLMAGGLLLITAALLLIGYNLWDEARAGAAVSQIEAQMPGRWEEPEQADGPSEEEIPDYILNPDMEMPTVEIDGNDYIGTLEIPSLSLSLPIMSDWSDAKLRVAPCRYAGTAYQSGFVIAAHNYRTHFGPIRLLAAGDEVIFVDVDGNRFFYQVAEMQILEPTSIEDMVDEAWDLSLFTCTLGGQTRLTVRCTKAQSAGWQQTEPS